MSGLVRVLRDTGRLLDSDAEARTLLAHVLGVEPKRLLLLDQVPEAALARLAGLVERRRQGVPLQHLTGEAHFAGVTVAVGPGVFIPRPETEVMTLAALDWLVAQPVPPGGSVVVELCAGSGAVAKELASRLPAARVHAVEVSADAMPYLEANLQGTGVGIVHADMADALRELDGSVDLVVANPPYIPLDSWAEVPAEVRDHDPALALFSGADGLDAIRVVADVAARLLRDGGLVTVEHADVQGESAPGIFVRHGAFDRVDDRSDLNGRPRFVVARRAGRMGP
jgi:release factor glutamine methyltransferase